MPINELAKLTEECGELCQIAAKKMNYMETDEHPDGKGSMKRRMEEEMGDVLGAIRLVAECHGLDQDFIMRRALMKYGLFNQWRR